MSNTTTQIRAAVVREKGGPFSIETLSLEGPRRDEVGFLELLMILIG
jgi:aryl-alcohol dehydrogenase